MAHGGESTRRRWAFRVLGLGVGMLAAGSLTWFGPWGVVDPRSEEHAAGFPTAEDRAIAFGQLLDSPRPAETIDKALILAERLRQRYGIDTGNPRADRMEAALRAKLELLDPLSFTEEEIRSMVASLGHSLEPEDCRNRCENVRRLAILELQKRALERFAEGTHSTSRVHWSSGL